MSGPGESKENPGVCQSFLLFDGAVRGRLVRLNGVSERILSRHDYPPLVTRLLAEAMVSSVALAEGLKFDGSFSFQIQADGPIHALVTDVTSAGEVRGCAQFHAEKIPSDDGNGLPSLTKLLGQGHLAFTVDQGPDTDRYQGIVELAGERIGDCIHQYFRQSEQLETAIKVTAGQQDDGSWQASAIMVQRMPERKALTAEEDEDAWRTSVILLSSLTDEELLDPGLTERNILERIFGSVGGRLLDPKFLTVGCRCSRDRSSRILASFPIDEVRDMAVDGKVSMTCEFCQITFEFEEGELESLVGAGAGDFAS